MPARGMPPAPPAGRPQGSADRRARAAALTGQPGHERTGHERTGHERTGHERTGHERTGHERTGHERTGHTGTWRPGAGPEHRTGDPARPVRHGPTGPTHRGAVGRTGGTRALTRTPPARGRGRTGPQARRRPRTARRTLGAALATTAAAVVAPGSGHLIMRRKRAGGLILGTFLLAIGLLAVAAFTMRRTTLLGNLVSTRALTIAAFVVLAVALGWVAVIARTYALARPLGMRSGQKAVGALCTALMCMMVALPFGFAADLANSQRSLLNALFSGEGGGTSAEEAIRKPRLNILLLGSDAGPDRTGTRTDTMMVASIEVKSGRTTLFALPRNIQRAAFPPGTAMAREFPDGFHDPSDPLSGNYLLNAVYAYAHEHPEVAPSGPTHDVGLNLLQSTVSYMLGLPIDYYLEVNMAGFAALIDAVGGVTVNVTERLPIDGVTADGRHVKPRGYIEPGVQVLDGETALWYARSRRDGSDYQRMGRQRCLIQAVLDQQSPAALLANFQSVAAATKDNVSTNIPQAVLPALVTLAGDGFYLESISFDPGLPDPNESDGQFNTARPDPSYMREVVQNAIDKRAVPAPATGTSTPVAPSAATGQSASGGGQGSAEPTQAAPTSLAESCAAPAPDTGAGG